MAQNHEAYRELRGVITLRARATSAEEAEQKLDDAVDEFYVEGVELVREAAILTGQTGPRGVEIEVHLTSRARLNAD